MKKIKQKLNTLRQMKNQKYNNFLFAIKFENYSLT